MLIYSQINWLLITLKKDFMIKKPLILVTNDDGIDAPGLKALTEVMNEIGEVVVVAPDRPQSGMGHAITINSPLYLREIKNNNFTYKAYTSSWTPADCIKIGVNEILKVKPDLCVSGINHGANSSVNVVYSGTMSAAIEAGIHGIPSIGFSLLDHKWNADFSHIKEYIKIITLKTLNNGLPKKVVLNVNFPNVIKKEIKGIKICRQANTYWIEKFDKRKNPLGKNYYWLTGEFINNDKRIDTDEWALSNNYISIVPTQFDFTSEIGLTKLNNWDFEK